MHVFRDLPPIRTLFLLSGLLESSPHSRRMQAASHKEQLKETWIAFSDPDAGELFPLIEDARG
jgi:hypothetical protein